MKKKLHDSLKFAGFILLSLSALSVSAQQWTSVQNGNWNNAATWGGSSYPPATLGSGKTVNIRHAVSITNSFASTLSINQGAALNIDGGTFLVGTGISMDNRGRFTGINGSLLQCLYTGCGTSGSQASGVWNTLDGGYTRMENMNIQIAQDWATTNGGKRYMKDCCVKTGQNFSVNNSQNRDTLINTRFEIGLHGSGNFQQNNGKVVYDNIDIDIAGSGGGNVQFNGGTFQGNIKTIRIQNINGNIQASSSMSGSIDLQYYCIQVPSNYQDPANKIKNEALDCATVNSLLSPVCAAGSLPPDEGGNPRRLNRQGPGSTDQAVSVISIYPNPFIQKLEIDFELDKAAPVIIILTDLTGREIYRATKTGTAGFNKMVLDNFNNLPRGLYITELHTTGGIVMRSKVLKK